MHEFYNYTNKFLGMSKVGVKVYFEKKQKTNILKISCLNILYKYFKVYCEYKQHQISKY